ncbi:MAG: CHAT domain-containing tetratricopeptide repeat protein [Aggregatilineales bacterium]
MSIDELKQTLCDESLSFSEKYARLRQLAPQLSADEVEQLSLALKKHSDGLRVALKPDPHTGVLAFLLGKDASHAREVAFGYAHLIYGVRYSYVSSNFQAACRHLERALQYFDRAQNEYGWAYTIITHIWAAFHVGKNDQLEENFARAKQILEMREDYELLSMLYGNTLIVYSRIDRRSERLIEDYLVLSDKVSPIRRIRIYNNIGYFYTKQGKESQSIDYHRQACAIAESLTDHVQPYVTSYLNLAESLRRVGRIQEALACLQKVRMRLQNSSPAEARKAYAQFAQNEAACLRALNRHQEALKTLQDFLHKYPLAAGPDHDYIYIQRELGASYAELGEYDQALEAFQKALDALNAEDEVNRNRLRLMRLAVQLRRAASAPAAAEAYAALQAEAADLQAKLREDELHGAEACLLLAQAHAVSDPSAALHHAELAVQAAAAIDNLPLQYEAHLTLGKLQAHCGELEGAAHNLQTAAACIEAMQRDMAIPFRARFLSNKGEALHHLVQLYIQQEDYSRAFDAIERSKASAFLSLIVGEDSLQVSQDAYTTAVVKEIEQLRAQLYAAEMGERPLGIDAHAQRNRLKQLTEQLYSIMQVQQGRDPRQVLAWQEIQAHLPEDALLIAFYEDDLQYNLFYFDAHSSMPSYARLACNSQEVAQLLDRIRFETDAVNFTLANYSASASPEATLAAAAADAQLLQRQHRFARHMEEAFQIFLAPLAQQLPRYNQLFIVPYGDLHNMPLHLLRMPATAQRSAFYLIEHYVVTILPTANLIAPRLTKALSSAFVIWDDRRWSANRAFRYAQQTADAICAVMPKCSTVHVDDVKPEAVFTQREADVIHLIAHAEYDPGYPTEACIWLGRQALEMSQILRQRLNGAVIFLNSCNVGQLHLEKARGKRAAGDDAIGLGRAFLYAGASALVSSLWNIFDGFTLPLIRPFYTALRKGASCAAALREAQLAFRDQFRMPQNTLHPIIWGAFQSIGR